MSFIIKYYANDVDIEKYFKYIIIIIVVVMFFDLINYKL